MVRLGRLIRRIFRDRGPWLLAALVIGILLVIAVYSSRLLPPGPAPAKPTPEIPGYRPTPPAPTPQPPVPPVGHPRLFFTREDIPTLRRRAETTHKDIWQPVLAFAQSRLGSRPPSMPKAGDLDGFRNAGNQVIATAFAYIITDDRAYLELARDDLLAYSGWRYWGDEGGYGKRLLGFHHMLMGVSIAYDWLYNDLSEADRKTVQSALATRAQESYEASRANSYVEEWANWWRGSYIQNHHWTIHSALGMAALALERDDPRSSTWLAQATDNLRRDTYLAQGIGDGSWHEGIPYQNYALTMSIPFLHNLNRLTGQDLIPHEYLHNYAYWRIYNYLPGSTRSVLSFGDVESGWENGYEPQGILRFIAADSRDGHAEWIAQQFASNGRDTSVTSAPWYVFEFLYYDASIQAKEPSDLSPTRTFPDLGAVIWRTGWGKDDLAFGLKNSVPGGRFAFDRYSRQQYPFDKPEMDEFNTGHEHEDAGSFYLYRGRVDLASETADYDKTATKYHNSILVDGKGQPRGDSTMTDPQLLNGRDAAVEATGTTDDFDYVIANGAGLYGGALGEFRRYVLFVRPDYLVMVDSIRSDSERRYEWVSHFDESVSVEGDWLKGMAEDGNVLGVRVVAPSDFSDTRDEDGKPYVKVRPSGDVEDVRFATVLFPTRTDSWKDRPTMTSLGDSGGAIGVRVMLNGVQDHLIGYGAADSFSLGDYSLDGKVASVAKDSDGELQRVFLGRGTSLADSGGSRVLIQAPSEITALELNYQGDSLSVSGDTARGVWVFAPGVDPWQVTVNGQRAEVSRKGDYLGIRG